MALLTTSSINSLVAQYEYSQRTTLVSPLNVRKTKYESLNTAYSDISSKLNSLKTLLEDFKKTGSDSVFASKTATSSNTSFITATAAKAANAGSYSLKVNQLAKNDLVVSKSMDSAATNAITGTHTFQIVTGDGSTGQYVSNIEVDFTGTETNQTVMEKIRNAVNSDKAVVTSSAKTGSASYAGGASEFIIDLNGTQHTISVNGGGTYSELIDEIVSNISTNFSGVTAEKVSDSPSPGDVKLRLTVNNSSDYVSISSSTGFDLVTDLGISVTKEKGAAGLVTASSYTPSSGFSQLSFNSKLTGVDNRIKSLSDTNGGTALSTVSLNLSSTRTEFNQTTNTAGFVYADITDSGNLLNSKFVLNGLNLQSKSNSVTDVVNDVTLNLKSEMQATDSNVAVTVGIDTPTIITKIEDFVKKFNDVYSYIKGRSSITSDSRGVLVGQANPSSIVEMFRSIAVNPVSGIASDKIRYLTQIGITFNSTSGLSVSNATLLEKKINENLSEVETIFNSSTGIATTLTDKITPYLGVDGYLAKSKSSFDQNIKYIKDRITATEKNISRSSDNLRNRYQDLQSQLATLLNMQGQFFGTGSSDIFV